jgi:hypothetical protein
VIISRTVKWAVHVASTGQRIHIYTYIYIILVGQPQRKIPLEDLGVDGKMDFKGTGWARLIQLRVGEK